ncbi:MAG: FAD-dependent oxidoreductase [Planctomycetota bacterium]
MKSTPTAIHEPARHTPVAWEGDLVVVGGSCTGVFAAVRAARLGLSVALVEQGAIFGGSATAAQVNEWHSLYDTNGQRQIIAGLTAEVVNTLRSRNALNESERGLRDRFRFNSAELAYALDELVRSHRIRPFLQARLVSATRTGDRIESAILEDKSGRRALRAGAFIDASGDGDLLRHAGFEAWKPDELQPVTLQALLHGFAEIPRLYPGANFWNDARALAQHHGLPNRNANPWISGYPGVDGASNVYGPRMNGVDASDADQLSDALLQGRAYIHAYRQLAKAQYPDADVNVIAWSQALGVRETWHASCRHRLTGRALLRGETFDDAIALGTYPIDIHHPDGTVLRWLNGTEERVGPDGIRTRHRWRDDSDSPPYYAVPYRTLLPATAENLWVAGRLIDADQEAFGAVRVMVNCNQLGEAAGVAAALAVQEGVAAAQVDPARLQQTLTAGGSADALSPIRSLSA